MYLHLFNVFRGWYEIYGSNLGGFKPGSCRCQSRENAWRKRKFTAFEISGVNPLRSWGKVLVVFYLFPLELCLNGFLMGIGARGFFPPKLGGKWREKSIQLPGPATFSPPFKFITFCTSCYFEQKVVVCYFQSVFYKAIQLKCYIIQYIS